MIGWGVEIDVAGKREGRKFVWRGGAKVYTKE
jgi:hypothetical protein